VPRCPVPSRPCTHGTLPPLARPTRRHAARQQRLQHKQLLAAAQDLQSQAAQYTGQLAAAQQQEAALAAQLAALAAQHDAALAAGAEHAAVAAGLEQQLASAGSARGALLDEAHDLRCELEARAAGEEALRAALEERQGTVEQVRAQLAAADQLLARLREERAAQEEQLGAAREQQREAAAVNARLQQHLQQLQGLVREAELQVAAQVAATERQAGQLQEREAAVQQLQRLVTAGEGRLSAELEQHQVRRPAAEPLTGTPPRWPPLPCRAVARSLPALTAARMPPHPPPRAGGARLAARRAARLRRAAGAATAAARGGRRRRRGAAAAAAGLPRRAGAGQGGDPGAEGGAGGGAGRRGRGGPWGGGVGGAGAGAAGPQLAAGQHPAARGEAAVAGAGWPGRCSRGVGRRCAEGRRVPPGHRAQAGREQPGMTKFHLQRLATKGCWIPKEAAFKSRSSPQAQRRPRSTERRQLPTRAPNIFQLRLLAAAGASFPAQRSIFLGSEADRCAEKRLCEKTNQPDDISTG
jgi:hypothetical protein